MTTTRLNFRFGLFAFVLGAATALLPLHSKANSFHSYLGNNSSSPEKHYLIAQTDPDEAYDPFSDYSEFDEDSEEEADVNFFRNGRFLTVGLVGGYRSFTDNMAEIYTGGPIFGVTLTYFFDLRLAMSIGFQTGDHAVGFTASNKAYSYSGNVSISSINFDMKHYMNTQNVTRGLADLNPYFLAGFGEFYRTYTLTNYEGYSRDSTTGFDIGAGVEIPLMRKKAFLGIQGTYNFVTFNDENKSGIPDGGGTQKLDKKISGDFFNVLMILGMNF